MKTKVKKEISPSIKWDDYMHEQLKHFEYAQGYLEVAVEEYHKDGDYGALLFAIRQIVSAQKGMSKLAKETNRSREALYNSLSKKGNPRMDTLDAVLKNLGFRISIEPIKEHVTV